MLSCQIVFLHLLKRSTRQLPNHVDKNADWVILGQFGRTHGIKGFITVHSFTDPRENILRYEEWFMLLNNQWQPLALSQIEVNDKHILVKVEGYDEREQVARLTNNEIGVPGEQLPTLANGEYYWHQLIGMHVINQMGDVFGYVQEIIPTGSNDVLVIEGDRRYLIPYLPGRYVLSVDPVQRQIVVDWDKAF